MFVAGRHVNVKRDGKLVTVNPGEPVPEAASWDHDVLMRCVKIGQILNVEKSAPGDLRVQMAAAEQSVKAQAAKAHPAVVAGAAKLAEKPASTSEVNHGRKLVGLSSSALAKAKRKAAKN